MKYIKFKEWVRIKEDIATPQQNITKNKPNPVVDQIIKKNIASALQSDMQSKDPSSVKKNAITLSLHDKKLGNQNIDPKDIVNSTDRILNSLSGQNKKM